mgnify:CR=1 FL=1|jgi:DNA-binding MarR family transcriptional regulator|tara:strand:- start:5324 stop:5818 length:495 start_codon:yes stop_codon:yes gene_type:complete
MKNARTEESLIAIRKILRATELFERRLAQSVGLTPAKLRVLQILASKDDERASPKGLATQMGVSQATVTVLVDKLVAASFVTRMRSVADRRQMHVLLTKSGREAIKDSPDALQQRFVKKFQNMQDWEQAQIVASLERVTAMLDATDIDASPVLSLGALSEDYQR